MDDLTDNLFDLRKASARAADARPLFRQGSQGHAWCRACSHSYVVKARRAGLARPGFRLCLKAKKRIPSTQQCALALPAAWHSELPAVRLLVYGHMSGRARSSALAIYWMTTRACVLDTRRNPTGSRLRR